MRSLGRETLAAAPERPDYIDLVNFGDDAFFNLEPTEAITLARLHVRTGERWTRFTFAGRADELGARDVLIDLARTALGAAITPSP